MANVTGSRGAPMNNDPRVQEILREAENNPGLLQQLMGMFGMGGGGETQTQSSRLTGDLGLTPMSTGPITTGGGSSGAVGNVAGASTYNPSRSFERQLGVQVTGGGGGGGVSITGGGGGAGGGGGSSIPGMGATAAAAGGGGRTPTVTTADGGKGFQNLLNTKGITGLVNNNRGMLGTAARYAGAGRAIEEAGQGNLLGAVGSGVGMFAAGRAMQGLAAGIPAVGLPGMLAKGALYATGSLLGSNLGADLLTGAGKMAGGIIPGAQGVVNAVTGSRREEGKSGLTGQGVGFSDKDLAMIEQLANSTGRNKVEIAREMLPIDNQYRNAELQRSMQQAQQNAQLRGALDRQLYLAQLTQGAQAEAGSTVRSILGSRNPYAETTFRG